MKFLRARRTAPASCFAQHCDILLFDPERGGVTRSQTTRELPGPQLQELGCMVEQDLSAYILLEHSEILTEQSCRCCLPRCSPG